MGAPTDHVLGIGAGDARFAERASQRLDAFVRRSSILVLATHSEELIRNWCNKAALIESGRLLELGGVDEVLKAYRTRNLPAPVPVAAE